MKLNRGITNRSLYAACSRHKLNTSIQNSQTLLTENKSKAININWLLPGCLIITLSVTQCIGQTARSREFSLKAAFLYNLTQFVEWPDAAFASPTAPFIIGILGEDQLKETLDAVIAGQKIKDHQIVLERYAHIPDIKTCHMLYVSEAEVENFFKAIASIDTKYLLTVSDAGNFANSGGIIRFYLEDTRIKIQINLSAAKAADLNISSKLLRLAEIIE